jgi:hypothetical protein
MKKLIAVFVLFFVLGCSEEQKGVRNNIKTENTKLNATTSGEDDFEARSNNKNEPKSSPSPVTNLADSSAAATAAPQSGIGQKHQSVSAFPGLGSITASQESSIEIQLSRDEVSKLVPCPQPIPECLQRQKKASRKNVGPDAGKAFVKIVFGDAPFRKTIEYGEGDYGLIVEGVNELKAHAVMIQVNKFGMVNGEMRRVPWPESTVLKRDIFGTSYLPMNGDKPFTLVFQVPAGSSSGSMRIKDDQIAVSW